MTRNKRKRKKDLQWQAQIGGRLCEQGGHRNVQHGSDMSQCNPDFRAQRIDCTYQLTRNDNQEETGMVLFGWKM